MTIKTDPVIVGAIDCGTNSIRLLVAQRRAAGLVELHREMRIVRLGQGVDATGVFATEALERTRAALADYVAIMIAHSVSRVRMVATSAARDAENREVFFVMAAEVLGTVAAGAAAEVISGTQEATLSFRGAVGELEAHEAPFVVVDLGGGSTEIVLGDKETGVTASRSIDVGCVRVTERFLLDDPPTAAQVSAARKVVGERVAEALDAMPTDRARTWIGLAGTMTTLSALTQGMTTYDPATIHLSRIRCDELVAVCDKLIGASKDQRAVLGPMHPGRADVIGGGAIIVQELTAALRERAGIDELIVSEHDILDGIALSLI